MSLHHFRRVYIEISNICNLQCSFCPVVERDKKRMTVEDFTTVLTQVAPMTDEICLHLMGEPLGHPELAAVFEATHRLEKSVHLTTNGTLIKRHAELLLQSKALRQINFSLQSYVDNHPGKPLDGYLGPILEFVDQALQQRPELYINFRLWNVGAEDDGTTEWILGRLEEWRGEALSRALDVGHIKSKRLKGRAYLHFDSRFEWPSLEASVRRVSGRCNALKDHIGVHADGRVVPCCLDTEANLLLGNIFDEPLADILESPRARAMLSGFECNKLVENLCQRCGFIDRFAKKTSKRSEPSPATRALG